MNDLPEAAFRPDEPRRYPSTVGGACYIVMGLVAIGGLGTAILGAWRTGLVIMGVALLGGALARLIVKDDVAGMLKVRRKSLDVAWLTLLGVALIVLAIVVPDA
ncbi:MAG: DUF3017 domain-containing protein [Nocardioidaceae bacterium]